MTVEHASWGEGAPEDAPPSIGAHYTDTVSGDQYIAAGTAGAEDWKLLAGAGQLPATVQLVPAGGSPGQVLTVGSGGSRSWATPEGGGGGLTTANFRDLIANGCLGIRQYVFKQQGVGAALQLQNPFGLSQDATWFGGEDLFGCSFEAYAPGRLRGVLLGGAQQRTAISTEAAEEGGGNFSTPSFVYSGLAGVAEATISVAFTCRGSAPISEDNTSLAVYLYLGGGSFSLLADADANSGNFQLQYTDPSTGNDVTQPLSVAPVWVEGFASPSYGYIQSTIAPEVGGTYSLEVVLDPGSGTATSILSLTGLAFDDVFAGGYAQLGAGVELVNLAGESQRSLAIYLIQGHLVPA